MNKEREGLEYIWTVHLKCVVFLGTLFGVDLEGISQQGVVFLCGRRKEKMVH